MNGAVALAAGAFGLVFLGAAVGKLDAWSGWTRLTERLPLPPRLRAAVRIGLPAVELGVAVLVVLAPRLGLAAAGAVLAVFAVSVLGLTSRLAGERCNCFGAILPSLIGTRLALRNAALAAVAAAADYGAWRTDASRLRGAELALAVMVGLLALLAAETRRFLEAGRESETAEGSAE